MINAQALRKWMALGALLPALSACQAYCDVDHLTSLRTRDVDTLCRTAEDDWKLKKDHWSKVQRQEEDERAREAAQRDINNHPERRAYQPDPAIAQPPKQVIEMRVPASANCHEWEDAHTKVVCIATPTP